MFCLKKKMHSKKALKICMTDPPMCGLIVSHNSVDDIF